MDSNDAKSQARNLDISFLESEIRRIEWFEPVVRAKVTSTNDVVRDFLPNVLLGSAVVVIADEQTQGRGRLDRNWSTPAGSGIAMSIGLHVDEFPLELSAVPLLSGVAVHRALQKFNVPASLKWPNDIIFTSPNIRKLGGILVQLLGDKLIIGIGLNVDLQVDELPIEAATSLSIEGFLVSREKLIIQVLNEFKNLKTENYQWLNEYKKICATIGKNITVINSDGSNFAGVAITVEPSGTLIVKNLEKIYQVSVGDIVHLKVSED